MKICSHILGFPRIGWKRELKKSQEDYWNRKISQCELKIVGKNIRKKNWITQKDMGLSFLSVGDFSWYDHVLTTSMMLGNIPSRFLYDGEVDLDTLFHIARGVSFNRKPTFPSEMTKWFNTNYHYIVPEFNQKSSFHFLWKQILEEIREAKNYKKDIKPIILGPMSYLFLGKSGDLNFNCLSLLPKILPVYQKILKCIKNENISWIQIDEPILALDLPDEWKKNFIYSYKFLKSDLKTLLTTYFGSITHNLDIIQSIPIDGLHIDLISGDYDLQNFHKKLPQEIILSLGIINGRNIWKTNLLECFHLVKNFQKYRKNIWIGTSCSLLHVPIDLDQEIHFDSRIKNYFSFAVQKCYELFLLNDAINKNKKTLLESWVLPLHEKIYFNQLNKKNIHKRLLNLTEKDYQRKNNYVIRFKKQQKKFNFPILPITTIGSFPQTKKLRFLRAKFKDKILDEKVYKEKIFKIIKKNIQIQEDLDIDVLVHGEPERNDMVEYFGENLDGFLFTNDGWVQSYGSRCVKPPIIFSDISYIKPITVSWIKYAQSLTKKPVKGMLTGPVTMLLWSFPREDISKKIISQQIALALQDEIRELEKNKINIIQVDEPALREGLPLRNIDQEEYLKWAVKAFKLSVSKVKDTTQIHTHMCYCEFNDIMQSIVDLDADVITIENARSNMEILKFFKNFRYPNSIGPGFYDIHSPNIPTEDDLIKLIKKSMKLISYKKLWVNPDCGLKTRTWREVKHSLRHLVNATKKVRILQNH
ncbi:5-methyltetrahydropteroyltriglutamate--homocysteine methyltransferase [Buchnera aphidicola (Sipha maydis)]|uniref:5-methyltetrahydropteroyltriglutamate-- homocysteine S-methyltransferase n=1 Tax=Buchnera aphidicola TaxID=9 RepID=UPI00346387E6